VPTYVGAVPEFLTDMLILTSSPAFTIIISLSCTIVGVPSFMVTFTQHHSRLQTLSDVVVVLGCDVVVVVGLRLVVVVEVVEEEEVVVRVEVEVKVREVMRVVVLVGDSPGLTEVVVLELVVVWVVFCAPCAPSVHHWRIHLHQWAILICSLHIWLISLKQE
jgi:hypothetical protein